MTTDTTPTAHPAMIRHPAMETDLAVRQPDGTYLPLGMHLALNGTQSDRCVPPPQTRYSGTALACFGGMVAALLLAIFAIWLGEGRMRDVGFAVAVLAFASAAVTAKVHTFRSKRRNIR